MIRPLHFAGARVLTPLFVLLLCHTPVPADARWVELTFDDAPDGTGPHDGHEELDNMEGRRGQLGTGAVTAWLSGDVRRSAIDAGRYGRAADFGGTDGVILTDGWESISSTVTTYMWVRARSVDAGRLIDVVDVATLSLSSGELLIEAADGGGGTTPYPTGVLWPTDDAYHHLAVTIDRSGAQPRVTLALDFVVAAELDVTLVSPGVPPTFQMGEGFDGLIDELLISEWAPDANALFDFSPAFCPAGLMCLEEVITTTPRDFTHPVPTRFKTVYDAALCSAGSPCPLLFDISGGNECADDYQTTGSVIYFAQDGFLVVTVDPYCEGDADTSPYPTETSQFVAVKDHLMTASVLSSLILGTEYSATGCSHGAGAVTVWALHEEDHPARTYARSPGLDSLCAFSSEVVCPDVLAYREEMIVELIGSLDLEDPLVQAFHARGASADQLTAEITATRDLAISWGVNLVGDVCRVDGGYNCHEEGLWGMNYGARRFRDVWHRLEPAGAPTGYFVEDRGEDCRHCAPVGSAAFECGACLLRNGRVGMEAACPECLDHDDPDIGPGRAAEPCDLDTSWYEDPLSDATPTNGGGGDSGGCGCRWSGDNPNGAILVLFIVFALLLRRLRPVRSGD